MRVETTMAGGDGADDRGALGADGHAEARVLDVAAADHAERAGQRRADAEARVARVGTIRRRARRGDQRVVVGDRGRHGSLRYMSSTRSTPGSSFIACASRGETLKPPGSAISTSCAVAQPRHQHHAPAPARPRAPAASRMCATASVRSQPDAHPRARRARRLVQRHHVLRGDAQRLALQPQVGGHQHRVAVAEQLARARQHLAEQVTSKEPAASDRRTQAMRLPVRVMRSLDDDHRAGELHPRRTGLRALPPAGCSARRRAGAAPARRRRADAR